jgi:hypothetical protein
MPRRTGRTLQVSNYIPGSAFERRSFHTDEQAESLFRARADYKAEMHEVAEFQCSYCKFTTGNIWELNKHELTHEFGSGHFLKG